MNREYLQMLIQMASDSLFSKEPSITTHNAEGAILLQLLFQVYAGTTVLNDFFDDLLSLVYKRMVAQPMHDHLKRHLLSVWLTALAYNPALTLSLLERHQLTGDFFRQVTDPRLTGTFLNTYERKTLIIGLTSALNAEQMPQAMAEHMLGIVQTIIRTLNRLKEQESKALKKQAKKEIKVNENEEDEEEDEEDEESEEEEEDEEVEGSDFESDEGEDMMEHDNDHTQEETKGEEEGKLGTRNEEKKAIEDEKIKEKVAEMEEEDGEGLGFVDSDEEEEDELDEAVS